MRLEQFLSARGQPVILQPGQILVRQGDLAPPFHLLQSGLLKACYLTAAGRESIKSFLSEGSIVGSLRCALSSEPSPVSIAAIESSTLLRFSLVELREAARQDLELANQLVERLLRIAMKKELREQEFLTLSPLERYRALTQREPHLLQRVTQNDIALYLGVTPVALSRMKGRAVRTAAATTSAVRTRA